MSTLKNINYWLLNFLLWTSLYELCNECRKHIQVYEKPLQSLKLRKTNLFFSNLNQIMLTLMVGCCNKISLYLRMKKKKRVIRVFFMTRQCSHICNFWNELKTAYVGFVKVKTLQNYSFCLGKASAPHRIIVVYIAD